MAKIYISSTFKDLEKYRGVVFKTLSKNDDKVIAMEEYVAQDDRPLQKCLEDVASCDIYVGMFAWRMGLFQRMKKIILIIYP